MAEHTTSVILEQLKLRQEAVLNKIDSLQLRVNDIQRERNVPYDTSNIKPAQFKKLQSNQASIFQVLLSIASQVDTVARKQNLDLPAQNEVFAVIQSMAQSLEKRQNRSLSQLKLLSSTCDSIKPWLRTKGKQPKMEQKEEKTEQVVAANKYKTRSAELKLVSESLRAQCVRMDIDASGQITTTQMNTLLEKVSLIGIDANVESEKHIQLLIDELSSDALVDYHKFLNYIMDTHATDKLANKSQWNRFRYNLIGSGRTDGSLRILYRYDGWPEPLSFVLKGLQTKNTNNMVLKEVLDHIDANSKDDVEFQELRYATNPTFVPGKRGWKPLSVDDKNNTKVPFLLNNEGTLEIDIWLRTKQFIVNKTGRPMPEEDEDLVDID